VTSDTLIQAFASAVAHEEGFYVAGSVPQRANNPCDLTDDGDVGCGVIQTTGAAGAKITVYPNVEAGWQAAYKKFGRMLNGASEVYLLSMTIQQVGMKFSGDATWGKNVAARLGLTDQNTLADYVAQGLGNNHDDVQSAAEGG
jgi:hypothetical protein